MQTNRFMVSIVACATLAWAGGGHYAAGAEPADAPSGTPTQEQPEVLTRGPIHEAFAQPVEVQAQAGLAAPLAPPPNIQEVPPAQRPDGANFAWVPGYWAWDADRHGHVWVSACWCAAPPGMYWVPGYWSKVAAGWAWIPGFWAASGAQEIEYLPAPPSLGDTQPQGAAPSPDQSWVPPCWYWTNNQYTRRPGYWLAPHPGWVWEPSHQVFTPRGYVFAEGHWDYSLERRGVLFAPVYFPPSVYAQAGYTYSPTITLDLGGITASLFVCPNYSHYYFGDYYDDSYVSAGIFPWCDNDRLHTWYDPLYVYDRAFNRKSDPQWADQQRQGYDLRHADKDLRPARTYQGLEAQLAKLPEAKRNGLQIARPLAQAVSGKNTSLKFQDIDSDTRNGIAKQAAQVNKFRDDRTKWETPAQDPKTAPPTADHQEPMIPAPDHKQPATPTPDHKNPAISPAVPFSSPTAPPIDTHAPVAGPLDDNKPSSDPAATDHPTRSEHVKISEPPIVGRPAYSSNADNAPPDRPNDEGGPKAAAPEQQKESGDHKNN